ncbi:MAG: putative sulfate exporter family transporter [Bacteroidota bacterium]|nr:putative sulfate exporter family transporter [Bacteroidota bacterium]
MNASKLIFAGALVLCLTPWIDAPLALLAGLIVAQITANPFASVTGKMTHYLLQASVVGLGFGMNAVTALKAGEQGLVFTICSIVSTLVLGWYFGKRLNVERKTAFLISSGTAICGGSAIAAISPIIKSNQKQISTALGAVFILNSVALFVFPFIGNMLHLSQHQFGVWAAIAIHDTSSVVGASARYGQEALQTATTIKLERALWIIPLSILTVFLFKNKSGNIKIPYFIFLFVVAMLVNTVIPAIHQVSGIIVAVSKTGLNVTLFLIGAGLTKETFKAVGARPFIQGILLWAFISVSSLLVIMHTIS